MLEQWIELRKQGIGYGDEDKNGDGWVWPEELEPLGNKICIMYRC